MGLALGVIVVVVGSAFVGVGIISNPALYVPLTLEVIVLLALTWFMVSRETDQDVQDWLVGLVFGALALRLGAFAIIHFGLTPYFFAPDAIGYEANGELIAQYWIGGLDPGERVLEGDPFSYNYLNAVFYFFLGDSALAVPMFNLFSGVWTCMLVFYLARRVFGFAHAKTASVIVATFPSMILWSVLNIRDALATLFVTLVVFLAVRLRSRFSLTAVAGLVGGVLVLSQLRDYVAFLVTAGVVLGYFLSVRPGKVVSTMLVGVVTSVGLAFVLQQTGVIERVSVEDPVAQVSALRSGLQVAAESAYGAEFDTSTLGGAIRFLPIGLAFLLFAPFPWAIESLLQQAAMPETLLWYPLFLMSLVGLGRAMKEERGWIPIAVLVALACTYALVEGNFGTAYRHRAQFMPIFFVFSGYGLNRFRKRFQIESISRKTGGRRMPLMGIPRPMGR